MSDNKQANENRETVADILAEMRQNMNPNGTVECQYLESDICTLADRIEAARVERAMRAYEGRLRNCDIGTAEEQAERMDAYCARYGERIGCSWRCDNCPLCSINRCDLVWAQMPYEAEEGGAK